MGAGGDARATAAADLGSLEHAITRRHRRAVPTVEPSIPPASLLQPSLRSPPNSPARQLFTACSPTAA